MRYRHLRRTVIAVLATTAFILLVGLLIRAVLTAAPTRRAAISWIERAAGSYGAELEIGELEWRLLPPGVRLRHVRLQTANLSARIDTLEVDLGRVWLTRRTVELGTVAARGVDVVLSGLPPRRGGGRPLQVEVRHLELVEVSFEGADLPGKIAVAIDGLRAGWTDDGEIARGYADAGAARVQFGRRQTTVEAGLRTRYEVADGALTLQSFHIDGTDFDLEGSGRLERGRAAIEATGSLDVGWLDEVIATRGLLDGEAQLQLALDTTGPTLLSAVVESPRLEVSGFTLEDVAGTMELSNERSLRGTLARARYRGGSLRGTYSLEGIGTSFEHRAAIDGSRVVLAGLLADLGVPPADLGARLDFSVATGWAGRAFARGSGHADVTLQPDAAGLPVAGELQLELLGDGMLRFDTPELRLGSSSVRWQGTLTLGGWEPAWSIAAEPARLDEMVRLVNAWVGSRVLPEELAGSGDLEVTISGPFSDLIVGARIAAHPLVLPPIAIDHLVADITLGAGMLRIGTARLQIGSGYGEVDGGLVWADDGGGEQLDLGIRGDDIPVGEVAAWIGLAEWVDRGRVSLQGRLGGSLAAPRGSWDMRIEDLVIGGVVVGSATTAVELEAGRFDWRGLSSDRGLQGELSWDVTSSEVAGRLNWPGMPLSPMGEPITSLVGTTADVWLDFDLPFARPATGTLRAVSERARLAVEAGPEIVTADAAVTGAVSGRAVLERSAGGVLQGGGELELISAASVLDLLAPDSGVPLEGTGGATFDFEWSEGQPPRVSGEVQHLDLNLADQPVTLIRPAAFSISGAGFEVAGLQLRAREDELFLRWAIDSEGGLRGNVSGTMDTVLLRFLLPEWEPAGRASGVVEMLGTVGSPLFEGIAEIHRGSFRLPGTRTILSQVQGTVLLSSGEVQLEGVDFRLMGGRGRCGGRIFERDHRVILAIGGTASGVRFEPLPSLRATLSGDWRLTGPVDDLGLAGELELERMSLESKESAANLLLSWLPQGERAAVGNGIRLDLHIEAEETIELRSPFVRLDASASLDVTGSSSEPGLVGQVEIIEGGEATLLGNRYEIERAGIAFSNPQAIEPFFDIQASTWVQEYQITVNLSGTLDNFVTTAVSTPPLSTPEIYSLLGVGYRREDLGSGAVGLGVASSLLTSELTSVLSERAQLVLPVDQVRVDPFAADSTGNPTARLSVIKQLTPYWTVILQTTLSGEREQIVTSRWYLAPGLFVEAAQREDGSLTFDLKLRRPY